ncbi:Subtilase family protein [Anaerosphaera aminiphila DSM 21120]|uniref:Subtilase family protein n=1 Tax=Anaerosphaera aminiphila DSM 21120 TaxID=1120995 RepID=A0A1M5S1C2_9FIRM|nr:S8 family peptidase [Anaerosphaera aminiphila]SHH32280.1 Subtilase family protein [Anaerosphaera aminiphila DSM 21120]
MSEKNLPIKIIMQRKNDIKRNQGGGQDKYFEEYTPELQKEMVSKFENILKFYDEVFEENKFVPAIGKITVKEEAIAKSHKPNYLCKECNIIGGGELDEIYIKVTKNTIQDTIKLIKDPPAKTLEANLTVVKDINPVFPNEKISKELIEINNQGEFGKFKEKIKIKLFDFDNDFDNSQIKTYVYSKLGELGLMAGHEVITYGKKIDLLKVSVSSFDDILNISKINGVKSINVLQDFSMPNSNVEYTNIGNVFDEQEYRSDVCIGIIDSGISESNAFLENYVVAREEYVDRRYQNRSHGTFVASMIQYGNELNNIPEKEFRKFNFIDIIAIPNSDLNYGERDSINEIELMEIIEEVMQKYSNKAKIWNLSVNLVGKTYSNTMSDLAIFLDYIQDEYNVQIFNSIGNLDQLPLREWPPSVSIGERDRMYPPADSVRAITVGSLAYHDSANSMVKANEPSPFGRRGPGANYIVKPEVVDYGGNISKNYKINGLGMKGLDVNGKIIEGNGTSYSTPRVTKKFASILDEMEVKNALLAKGLLIHSAKMHSRDILDQNSENIKYFGFGIPMENASEILHCSESEVTLIFQQEIISGTHLELVDFPFPKSLIRDNKYFGEIIMTLVYQPILDENFGVEYCRTNIDVGFGRMRYDKNGELKFNSDVPLEVSWDDKFEKSRVEHGFKWCPVKSYYRNIKNGINLGEGWKLRLDLTSRNGLNIDRQEFVLLVTFKDSKGNDIYTDITNELKEKGYSTNNLKTKALIRERHKA